MPKWNAAPEFRLSFEKKNKDTTLRLFFTEPGQKNVKLSANFKFVCGFNQAGAPVSKLVLITCITKVMVDTYT